MFVKVLFLISLYALEAASFTLQFEDNPSDKGILEISEKLRNVYYNLDWKSDYSDKSMEEEDSSEEQEEAFDSWSLVWYIASFGGLIVFFLVVSCSEWCCRKHVREQQSRGELASPPSPSPATELPPPAYDLFAPPSYESLNYAGTSEKTEYDVFVVPVHAIGSLVDDNGVRQGEEDPPSYNSVSQQQTNNQTISDI